MDIIDTIKIRWRSGSMLLRLIFINVGVFIALHIVGIAFMFTTSSIGLVLEWIELPSRLYVLSTRPWTAITYMFAQYDLFHILFNMVWLYWFGSVFLLTGTGKRMLALYIYGGLGGAALFMLAYNFMPVFSNSFGWLIGSSASVIAIVAATAILHPDYRMHLMFIGGVSLKWIAIITIGIDLVSITGDNGGGHIAHIGGAIVGVVYAAMLRRGIDITKPFNRLADQLATWFKKPRRQSAHSSKYTRYTYSAPQTDKKDASKSTSKTDEEKLDKILDKIKKSGYAALTQEEKQKLFDVTRKMK